MENLYLKYLEMIKEYRKQMTHSLKENSEFYHLFPNLCAYEDEFGSTCKCRKKCTIICDPIWEKGPLG